MYSEKQTSPAQHRLQMPTVIAIVIRAPDLLLLQFTAIFTIY